MKFRGSCITVLVYMEITLSMSNCARFAHFILDIVMVMAIDFFLMRREKKYDDYEIYLFSFTVKTVEMFSPTQP